MLGERTLNTWATSQASVPMSSAEAEYNAMDEGSTRGLGMQTLWGVMNVASCVLAFSTDSPISKPYASKRGLSKMRPIAIKRLWF